MPQLILLPLLLLSLTTSAAPTRPPLLRILAYADLFAPDTLHQFSLTHQVRIQTILYNNDQEFEQLLIESDPPIDLAFPATPALMHYHITNNLYQPLPEHLQVLDEALEPPLRAPLAQIDPAHRYLIPYLYSFIGLLIDQQRLQQYLPADQPLDSWQLLFEPATLAALGECTVSVPNEPLLLLPQLLATLQQSSTAPLDRHQLEQISARLALLPTLQIIDYNQLYHQIWNQEPCIAMIEAQTQLSLNAELGRENRYTLVWPREGHIPLMLVAMAIPHNARQPALAQQLIAYLQQPEPLASIAAYQQLPSALHLLNQQLNHVLQEQIHPPLAQQFPLYRQRYSDQEYQIIDAWWSQISR